MVKTIDYLEEIKKLKRRIIEDIKKMLGSRTGVDVEVPTGNECETVRRVTKRGIFWEGYSEGFSDDEISAITKFMELKVEVLALCLQELSKKGKKEV